MTDALFCGVDIGAAATKVVLVDAAGDVRARVVRLSGVDFTRAVAERLDLTSDAAADLRRQRLRSGESGFDASVDRTIYEASRPLIEELAREASLCLRYFTVAFTGESQREWAPVNLVANQAGNDWAISWTPRWRLGTPANPIKSAYHYGWRIRFRVGATWSVDYDVLDPLNPAFTYTEAQQIADFGSAQGSFDEVAIMGLNLFSGEDFFL